MFFLSLSAAFQSCFSSGSSSLLFLAFVLHSPIGDFCFELDGVNWVNWVIMDDLEKSPFVAYLLISICFILFFGRLIFIAISWCLSAAAKRLQFFLRLNQNWETFILFHFTRNAL